MPENVNTSELVIDQSEEAEDNRSVMIKVDHVSMSFNMASEQMNSLKEYAVALAKRKLFFEEFKALDDVSFEVRKGDVFGIMGTNGSGKSTMLKIIAGVLEPTKGTCQVNGNIAPLIELGAGFDMDLSARENIYLNGALLGYSKQFIDENFDAIIEFAEVEKFLDMPLKNYSSGMVARIAFAIATVIVPEILVVDEVLSVGDFMFQKKCEDRITELIEQHGVTVLIVSHNNDQIARLCNKAIWIEKGHERLQGDAEMVCRVYGALGGRTGSKEAEEQVFESLVHDKGEHPESAYEVIAGETLSATSSKLVLRSWGNKGFDTVALATDRVHADFVIGNPLAAAYNAPMLSVGDGSSIPDSVMQLIDIVQPSRILLFDCNGAAEPVFETMKSFPWNPEVVRFYQGKDLLGFSYDVYKFGAERSFWGSALALIGFNDNPAALVSSPYIYDAQCPVLMMNPGDRFEELVSQPKFNHLHFYSFGEEAASRIKGCALSEDDQIEFYIDCMSITEFVFAYYKQRENEAKPVNVCFASKAIGQWPELISCGCFASRQRAALSLLDQTSLDSDAENLSLLKSNAENIGKLFFIGEKLGLSSLERSLLLSQVC